MSEKWKQLLKSGKGTWILIAVCAAAALFILLMPEKEEQSEEIQETASLTAEAYSEALSARIAQMVSAITGEADPHVTVTLKSMGETVYACLLYTSRCV